MNSVRFGTAWNEQNDYSRAGLSMNRFEQNILKRYLFNSVNSSVLDVGGGIGIHAMFLQKHGLNVTIVDLDESALKRARSLGLNAFKLSGTELYKLNNSYSNVICIDVPYLTGEGFEDFINSVNLVLDNNGFFIFNFSPKKSYKNLIKKVIHDPRIYESKSYYYYDIPEILEILKKMKLKIVKIYTYNWLPFKVNSNSILITMIKPFECIFRYVIPLKYAPRIIFVTQK